MLLLLEIKNRCKYSQLISCGEAIARKSFRILLRFTYLHVSGEVFGVDDYGDRTVVDEFHLHVRAEAAALHWLADGLFHEAAELFVAGYGGVVAGCGDV